MKELAGRTAVVTGGASGIGRGIALALAAAGMRVAVADLDGDGAAGVARELGAGAFGLRVDVTSTESLAAAAEEVRARTGGAHVLVNNAGVMLPLRPIREASEADWEFVLSVNLLGVVKGVAAFLPQLRAAAPEAHVVNTASMGGLAAVPMFPLGPYVTSKYACVGYSESLRAGMVATNLAASSAKARPARLGRQAAPSATEAPDPALAEHFWKAEDVGPVVVRGIRANRLHLLTHLEARAQVERRFRGILADFDAEAHERDGA
jgi:NAD(P)-dependent dehydrogenase (short-subunit alcohol dehydrogenase family)